MNDIDSYISAADHFGRQSPTLVRHYAEDLGYEYMAASSKDEFDKACARFVTPELTDRPMIFEVFTKVEDENDALFKIYNMEISAKHKAKQALRGVLGDSVIGLGKKILKK